MILPDDYIRQVTAAVHDAGGMFVLDCIASGCIWADMKALGVDVRGRSRTLKVNYRTSHQIRAHADRLLGARLAHEAWQETGMGRYEDKVEGLGREFLLTIDGSLTAVGQFPEMARVYHKTIRRLVVSRFPYGIFYAVEGQRIIVHAVLDLRQDPEDIRNRLG